MPSHRELANAVRALSMDAVQQANSGHPGAPLGMADIAQVLWGDYLRHNPNNPRWSNRDRFVLSNGHASMLLYSLLHLTGYDLSLDELRNFRQLGSKTAGHPEFGVTPGVETTTGPLGQGLANAIGMAIAEASLAAQFNRPGFDVVDHHTYVFLGDGCLMEGISHEVCSLAGTLRLGKLIGFYDDNGISIDGEVEGWFTDDTPARFRAYGWHVIDRVDGHDAAAVSAAIEAARAESGRPTLICCQTQIAWGSPNKVGTAASHGAPLGDAEIALTRKQLGWEHPPFEIPAALRAAWDSREAGAHAERDWQKLFDGYRSAHPELAETLERRMLGRLPANWRDHAAQVLAETDAKAAAMATRKASQAALEGLSPLLPELIGGSADLTGSNNTTWSGSRTLSAEEPGGNYVYYGVREFGMSAIANGLALHGGVIPYTGTFLVFSDYARNALRMAALMGAQNIFVYTHDSIGLGEDGPTHQPVEQLASLRLIPNMSLWRPCDAVECVVAWQAAIERRDGPTSLVFSRQGVPHQTRTSEQLRDIQRGGYVLRGVDGMPDAIIIATGSEVSLAMEAAEDLAAANVRVQVVSMPSSDVFDAQEQSYRDSVLPPAVGARVAIEAGVPDGWWRYVGSGGRVLGIARFGESAPAKQVFEHLGLSAEALAQTIRETIQPRSAGTRQQE